MKQRWLWNFPEGPCSYCYPHWACQSLTSAAIVIGWRAYTEEPDWLAEQCHIAQSFFALSLSLSLTETFCCNAVIFIHVKLKSYSFWYSLCGQKDLMNLALIVKSYYQSLAKATPDPVVLCAEPECPSIHSEDTATWFNRSYDVHKNENGSL